MGIAWKVPGVAEYTTFKFKIKGVNPKLEGFVYDYSARIY